MRELWDYVRWVFTEGFLHITRRWVDAENVRSNLFTPVEKLKDVPVSGDALAAYRKDWVA